MQLTATAWVFAVNPELERIYEDLAPDEPHSRLEPYRDLILRLRRQGRTYHRIRSVLADKCGVKVAYATLDGYINRRARPRKVKPALEIEPPAPMPPPTNETKATDPYAEARERMRLFKEAPVAAKPRKVFEVPEEDLDGTKPLRMMKPNQPKEK